MGLQYLDYVSEEDTIYVCRHCSTHLALPAKIASTVSTLIKSIRFFSIIELSWKDRRGLSVWLSVSYTCMWIKNLWRLNVASGPPEEKELATGLHRVRDIYCKMCLTVIGWTYVSYTFVITMKFWRKSMFQYRISPIGGARNTRKASRWLSCSSSRKRITESREDSKCWTLIPR